MALAVGTKAPEFSLPTKTADGPKQIKLSENFGKANTLLLFFPMAFTGTCTTEMCGISNGLREYTDLNASVYGISGDNPFAQEAFTAVAGVELLQRLKFVRHSERSAAESKNPVAILSVVQRGVSTSLDMTKLISIPPVSL